MRREVVKMAVLEAIRQIDYDVYKELTCHHDEELRYSLDRAVTEAQWILENIE